MPVRSVLVVTGPEKGEDRFGNDRALSVALWAGEERENGVGRCGGWRKVAQQQEGNNSASANSGRFVLGGVAEAFPVGVDCLRLELLKTQTNWLVVKLIFLEYDRTTTPATRQFRFAATKAKRNGKAKATAKFFAVPFPVRPARRVPPNVVKVARVVKRVKKAGKAKKKKKEQGERQRSTPGMEDELDLFQ